MPAGLKVQLSKGQTRAPEQTPWSRVRTRGFDTDDWKHAQSRACVPASGPPNGAHAPKHKSEAKRTKNLMSVMCLVKRLCYTESALRRLCPH